MRQPGGRAAHNKRAAAGRQPRFRFNVHGEGGSVLGVFAADRATKALWVGRIGSDCRAFDSRAEAGQDERTAYDSADDVD